MTQDKTHSPRGGAAEATAADNAAEVKPVAAEAETEEVSAPAAPAAEAPEEAVEAPVVATEEAPAPAQDEAAKYLELARRTQADFDNYRKRMARENAAAAQRGAARLA